MWYLTEYILKERPHGFVGAIVWGNRSIGKTVYALKIARQLFLIDGYSDNEAWQKALDSCVFLIDDLIKVVKQHDYKNKAPIIIWDDAGFHGSGMLYHVHMAQAMLLKGIADTVRSSTESFILTTPSIKGLMSFLTNYGDYEIKITKNYGWQREAKLIKERIEPWGKRRRIDKGTDGFSAYVPNKWYHEYMTRRDRYKDIIMKEIEKWEKKRMQKVSIGQTSKHTHQYG